MKINWKVRVKSKTFWLTLVPALLLLAQIVTSWFGYNFAADLVGEEITRFI
ncbi:phi LC3 family holin, partial [Paraliobacillus ryukyuensis]